MKLNTISFKEMISHPYMPFELAKEIAVYRKKHKSIQDLDELLVMKNQDSVIMKKLTPYLGL